MSMNQVAVFLVLVMGATVGTAPGCPRECQCHHQGLAAQLQVTCSPLLQTLETDNNTTLTAMQIEELTFPSGSTSVTMQNYNKRSQQNQSEDYIIRFLSEKLTQQDKLQQLTLKNCKLNPLNSTDNIIITLSTTLEELHLNNCSLTQVPHFSQTRKQQIPPPLTKVSFQPNSTNNQLKVLDLSNNVISAVTSANSNFRTLSKLQVLDLSSNVIDRVSADGFSGLAALQRLDLSANRLSALDGQIFQELTSLQQLNMSRNSLEVLGEMCFSGLQRLQQLDMSWNKLARVNPGTLQLPSLARLLLAGNPTLGAGTPEPSLLVGTGRRLQTVDVSRTGLVQVPAALTHSVRTLRLEANSIHTVQCGDLDSYPLLQLLDLTSNNLYQIEEDALGRLDGLTILYLSDNKLQNIPLSLPTRLRIVHLERNEIRKISSGDLQGLTKLEVLLLNDNHIEVIDEGAFSSVTALASLDLSRNTIANLPPGALLGPRQLQVLRLAGLKSFGGFSSPITRMNVSAEYDNDNIAEINNKSSAEVEQQFPLLTPEYLVTLDLGQSPEMARMLLEDTATMAAFRELQELDLRGCNLQEIRSDLRHFLPQLRVLHIVDNPLNCTGLEWLGSWMRRQDQQEYRMVTCVSPPEVAGTLLIDLQEEETSISASTVSQTHSSSPSIEAADRELQAAIATPSPNAPTNLSNKSKTEMGVTKLFPAGKSHGVFTGSVLQPKKNFSSSSNGTFNRNFKVNPIDFYRKKKPLNTTSSVDASNSALPVKKQVTVAVPTINISSVYVNNDANVSNSSTSIRINKINNNNNAENAYVTDTSVSNNTEISVEKTVETSASHIVDQKKSPEDFSSKLGEDVPKTTQLPVLAPLRKSASFVAKQSKPEADSRLAKKLVDDVSTRGSNYPNKALFDRSSSKVLSDSGADEAFDNNIFIATPVESAEPGHSPDGNSNSELKIPTKGNAAAVEALTSAKTTTLTKKAKAHKPEKQIASIVQQQITPLESETGTETLITTIASTLTAGEMSPYQMNSASLSDLDSADVEDFSTDVSQHPGMLVLAIGILLSVTALGTLASRISRRRRAELYSRQQDIEVSSIGPHTTELW